MKRLVRDLQIKNNCHPMKNTASFWLQFPLWISVSYSLRNMTSRALSGDLGKQYVYLATTCFTSHGLYTEIFFSAKNTLTLGDFLSQVTHRNIFSFSCDSFLVKGQCVSILSNVSKGIFFFVHDFNLNLTHTFG